MELSHFFTATADGWAMPLALTVIVWAVAVATLSRYYSLPQLVVKLHDIMLLCALAAVAVVAWITWCALR